MKKDLKGLFNFNLELRSVLLAFQVKIAAPFELISSNTFLT